MYSDQWRGSQQTMAYLHPFFGVHRKFVPYWIESIGCQLQPLAGFLVRHISLSPVNFRKDVKDSESEHPRYISLVYVFLCNLNLFQIFFDSSMFVDIFRLLIDHYAHSLSILVIKLIQATHRSASPGEPSSRVVFWRAADLPDRRIKCELQVGQRRTFTDVHLFRVWSWSIPIWVLWPWPNVWPWVINTGWSSSCQ